MVHQTSLLNETEVDVNNYAGREECYWPGWITARGTQRLFSVKYLFGEANIA